MKEKIKRNALGHYYFRCIKCLSQIHQDNFSSFHYIDLRASIKIQRNSFYNKICMNKWPIHIHVFNSHLKSRTSTWIFYLFLINKRYSDKRQWQESSSTDARTELEYLRFKFHSTCSGDLFKITNFYISYILYKSNKLWGNLMIPTVHCCLS